MKKSIFITIALILTAVLLMSGCSPNLRDVKISQLTMEQEEKVMKQLTKEEQQLLASYQIRMAFNEFGNFFNEIANAATGQKPTPEQLAKKKELTDISINEAIKSQREFENGSKK